MASTRFCLHEPPGELSIPTLYPESAVKDNKKDALANLLPLALLCIQLVRRDLNGGLKLQR